MYANGKDGQGKAGTVMEGGEGERLVVLYGRGEERSFITRTAESEGSPSPSLLLFLLQQQHSRIPHTAPPSTTPGLARRITNGEGVWVVAGRAFWGRAGGQAFPGRRVA